MDDNRHSGLNRKWPYALFTTFLVLFWTHWLLQRNGYVIPIVHAYMDDFICIPIMLFPLLLVYRKWLVRSPGYTFPLSYVLMAWIVLCVVFEIILPIQNKAHISDPIDMVLYGLGGCVFWAMQKGKIVFITLKR